jgi:hypothetical protein
MKNAIEEVLIKKFESNSHKAVFDTWIKALKAKNP